jgi:hypothetical protein
MTSLNYLLRPFHIGCRLEIQQHIQLIVNQAEDCIALDGALCGTAFRSIWMGARFPLTFI